MIDYETVTARDIRRMVNRAEVSPAELGLLVLWGTREVEYGRKSPINNELIRWIESKWVTKPYANSLDYFIDYAKHLVRLEYTASRSGLYVILEGLRIQMIAMYAENTEYSSAYKRLYELYHTQAGDIAGLSRAHAAHLAEEAPDKPLYPSKAIAETWEAAIQGLSRVRATDAIFSDLGKVLGMSFEHEERKTVEKLLEGSWKLLEKLGTYNPKISRALSRLTDYASVEPDKATEKRYETAAGAYLSPNWRQWARAGISLREAAQGSDTIAATIHKIEIALFEKDWAAGKPVTGYVYIPEQEGATVTEHTLWGVDMGLAADELGEES